MKNIKKIALTTIAALTMAAGLSAAQTTPNTSTNAAPAPVTPSSIAKTAASNASDAVTTAEQKVVTSAQEKVAVGEQKATNVKQKTAQLRKTYLGYLNQIPKTSRAKYQKIATSAGLEKAIAAIKKDLGKANSTVQKVGGSK